MGCAVNLTTKATPPTTEYMKTNPESNNIFLIDFFLLFISTMRFVLENREIDIDCQDMTAATVCPLIIVIEIFYIMHERKLRYACRYHNILFIYLYVNN